jgi:hypothetical protein
VTQALEALDLRQRRITAWEKEDSFGAEAYPAAVPLE